MKQPKSKLNISLLNELIEYPALLVDLYHILASEAVFPEGGHISQRRPYLMQPYNKILYQVLYGSFDRAWLT